MKKSVKSLVLFLALGLVFASPAEAMPRWLDKVKEKVDKEANRIAEQAKREADRLAEQVEREAARVEKQAAELLTRKNKIQAQQKRLDDLEARVNALTGRAAPLGGAGEPPAEDFSDAQLLAIDARIAALTAILEELASRPPAAPAPAAAPTKDDGFYRDDMKQAIDLSLLRQYLPAPATATGPSDSDPVAPPAASAAVSSSHASDPTVSLASVVTPLAPALPTTVDPTFLIDAQASEIYRLRAQLEAARASAQNPTPSDDEAQLPALIAAAAPLPAPARAAPRRDPDEGDHLA